MTSLEGPFGPGLHPPTMGRWVAGEVGKLSVGKAFIAGVQVDVGCRDDGLILLIPGNNQESERSTQR
jgi:hypothetical protein